MGYSANRKKELETTSTLSYTQKRKQELEKESLASNKGMTVEQFDRSKFADAENARKAQMQKELNSIPEPTNLESFNKKTSETKWYEPKIGLVKDFLKLDTSDKQKVAQKATEDMTNSDLYAIADAAADKAFIIPGLRPALQKAIFEKVPNGEDYLKKKQETADKNPIAHNIGTVLGYIAPGAAVEKVAAKALAPTLANVGSKIGQKAIFGAVTGGGMELAEGLIRGDNPEDLANRTATGAVFGGIGDAAVYGIGKGIHAISGKIGKTLLKNHEVPEELAKEIKRAEGAFSIDSEGNVYRDGKFLKKLNKGGGNDVIKSEGTQFVDQYGHVRGTAETDLQIPELKQLVTPKKTLEPTLKAPKQYQKEFPSRVLPGELGLPKTTVAEKIPNGATTSYKPETSLKTDLTKPSEVIPDVLPEPTNKVVMDTPKNKSTFKESLSDLYRNVVSKNNELDKFSKLAKDNTGMLASNTGNVNGVVDEILQTRLNDRQGKAIGKSFKEVVDKIPEGKEADFWQYMSQRHNIDRAREGKNVIANYTSDMSKKAVEQIELANPEWKTTGDDITNWIDAFMREWGVKAGTVDEEIYNGLRETYKSYFPTQREFSQLESSIPGNARKQFVDSNSPIGKATGSDRDIHNPIANIMNLVDRTVKTAKYNEVGQELLNSVRKEPEKLKALAEVIKIPKTSKINPETMSWIKVDKTTGLPDNIVTVLENGKPVYLQINDKRLLDTLKGLPKMVNNAQAMRKISNVYKSLITTKNPIFAITNMARDIPTSYVYGSTKNPIKFTGDLLKAGKDVLTNSENLKRYNAVGGGGANFLAGNADKAAKDLLKKPNVLSKVGGAIEKVYNLTETVPRLAEFNRVFEKTGDVQKALYASNEVSTNFARGGNFTKSLDPFVPYLNAGVQGLDKFFRQVKNKPLDTLIKGGIAITVPEVGLYLLNKDDPDYQALDNRTKDTYFLIPKGDGTFTKIPKSRELGVLFGSLFQRLARAGEGEKEAFKGFGNTVATNFSPTNPIENNIISPLTLNLKSNKDFANRAIVPMGMQMDKRSKYLQYDEKTTEIAKAIGKLAADATDGEGLSPKQIDYIMKTYTGIIGQVVIPATTKGGNPLDAVKNKFVADPLYSNQTVQDFYDNYTKVQQKAADNNILNKLPSKLTTPEEIMEGKFRKASSQISDLNKQIKNTKDEATIRELKKQIIVIAKEVNNMLK